MKQSAQDVSIVICTYTAARWQDLIAAVESVRAQPVSAHEIIVVVDYNPSLLERVCRQIPGVVVVENSEARGLSGARNSGIAAAGGAIIAFLDDDAIAAPDWLERLRERYTDPRVIGVGGAIRPLWQGGRPAWFPEEFDWVVGCTYRGMPRATAPVRNLIGCNMSFRREVFQSIGGFRSGIGRVGTRPVGCEETELCIRAGQHWPDRALIYEPHAYVDHRVPLGRARWDYFCSRCYAEGCSKALLARFVGTADGLASERAYTLRTLPRGVAGGLADAVRHGDPTGLARAGAILAGLAMTGMGYMAGVVSGRLPLSRQAYQKHSFT